MALHQLFWRGDFLASPSGLRLCGGVVHAPKSCGLHLMSAVKNVQSGSTSRVSNAVTAFLNPPVIASRYWWNVGMRAMTVALFLIYRRPVGPFLRSEDRVVV